MTGATMTRRIPSRAVEPDGATSSKSFAVGTKPSVFYTKPSMVSHDATPPVDVIESSPPTVVEVDDDEAEKRKRMPTGNTPVRVKKRTEPRRSGRLITPLQIDLTSSASSASPATSVVNLVTSTSVDIDKSISPKYRKNTRAGRHKAGSSTLIRIYSDDHAVAMATKSQVPAAPLRHDEAIEMLNKAFAEVEKDDRAMYRVTDDFIRDETATIEKSALVETTDAADLRRMCTYGEIDAKDFSKLIMPYLDLNADDVFYDLGCGTGKIVLHVALQTPCRVSKGIELMLNRVSEGHRALDRATVMCPSIVPHKTVRIVHGDLCFPPEEVNLMDATVVFINNVVFPPALMTKVLEILGDMQHLRRVVSMRKLCERHRPERCGRHESACVGFAHPPVEDKVGVSWAKDAPFYVYDRVV
ncbi:hypothetical protein, variant 1 [Aphanomyces invadans]|uniref:Histone-lysine N-methyltransferase, H3 lysine-79 specific n=1 Tax=Aphanomyces invadans TaxID=157072 RepID=A0A024TVB9_9STRA|nr:hypothetical protein, variant 1 [Aphanomyces invadans]ETV97958.1 hypothetical protein, variant 1 [Aphanomyces invadans]|eukprot:XP_008873519.1 hypothetical protein, variant 1 [Aphanomyces invadans]